MRGRCPDQLVAFQIHQAQVLRLEVGLADQRRRAEHGIRSEAIGNVAAVAVHVGALPKLAAHGADLGLDCLGFGRMEAGASAFELVRPGWRWLYPRAGALRPPPMPLRKAMPCCRAEIARRGRDHGALRTPAPPSRRSSPRPRCPARNHFQIRQIDTLHCLTSSSPNVAGGRNPSFHDQCAVGIHRRLLRPIRIGRFACPRRTRSSAPRPAPDDRPRSAAFPPPGAVLLRQILRGHRLDHQQAHTRSMPGSPTFSTTLPRTIPSLTRSTPHRRDPRCPPRSSRAGVVLPRRSRAMSPSVETSTVAPRAGAQPVEDHHGSPLALPSVSSRCAIRKRQPWSVSCLAVAVTVPSMRAKNILR